MTPAGPQAAREAGPRSGAEAGPSAPPAVPPAGSPTVPGSRWGLLARRDFRLLWAGESISKLGSGVTAVALPLVAVVSLGAGPLAAGLLSAAVWLPWLVIGLPAGVWVGRWSRRAVLVRCNLASALLYASVPAAGWLGVLTLTQLLVVALLAGTAAVFFGAAYQAYLPELVRPEELTEGNAKLQSSASAAQVAGPGVAGLTVQAFGAAAGLLVDAVSFLAAAALLLLIRGAPGRRRERAGGPAPGASLGGQVREGLAFVRRDPYLRALLRYGAAANFALAGYQAVAVLFLLDEVGADPATIGRLAAAAAFGGVLGAALARPVGRWFGTARGVRFVLSAATPFGLLLPAAGSGPGVLLYALGSAVMVAAVVLANVVFGSFRQAYAPPALLSRVLATASVANHATIPLGALAGGVLGAALGLRETMWTMTSLLVLCGGVLLASPIRTVRDLPAGAAGQGGPAARRGVGGS
ncbi:MFS transporter [Kitasatospora sp. NPDC058406]|uniref:MFS transporter n=1 Tax=Kitasatospora sp. NPDC058406 TaxID=3346483 RepID=UPI00364BDF70